MRLEVALELDTFSEREDILLWLLTVGDLSEGFEFEGEVDLRGTPTGSAKLDVRLGPIEEDEVSFFLGTSKLEAPVEAGDF